MSKQRVRFKAAEYLWIARWGGHVGSLCDYVVAEQHAAAEDGAPLDAIYRKATGAWATVRDIVPGSGAAAWLVRQGWATVS